MSALDVQSLLQSLREEFAELLDHRQRDEYAFYSDTRALLRLEAVMEQIDTISRARADQRVKHIQGALATASATAPKKQMFPRLVHGTSMGAPALKGHMRLPTGSERLVWWRSIGSLFTFWSRQA